MLMILARLGRSESFWAVVKVRSPHTGPEVYVYVPSYPPPGGVRIEYIEVILSSFFRPP